MDFIFKLGGSINTPARYGLSRIEKLSHSIGDPQDKLKNIHVAGTKGKGSTTKFIESILSQAGYRTGMYISPSLTNIVERISINGEVISPREFTDIATRLTSYYSRLSHDDLPSTFETLTMIAFLYFLDKNVDFSVIEVGLGGRLDATNIIKSPLVSVITEISYDHQKILGDTLAKIAFEKAGIIKPLCPVVVGSTEKESVETIVDFASAKKSEVFLLHRDFSYKVISESQEGLIFDFESRKTSKKLSRLRTRLKGEHQARNAALAIQVALLLREARHTIPDDSIFAGVERAFWPARLETIREKPKVIVDGAHNGSSAHVLVESLKRFDERVVYVFSMLADKNVSDVLRELSGTRSRIVLTEVPGSFGRRVSVSELYCKAREFFSAKDIEVIPNPRHAYFETLKNVGKSELICVTGSLYLAGYVRKLENVFSFSFNLL